MLVGVMSYSLRSWGCSSRSSGLTGVLATLAAVFVPILGTHGGACYAREGIRCAHGDNKKPRIPRYRDEHNHERSEYHHEATPSTTVSPEDRDEHNHDPDEKSGEY